MIRLRPLLRPLALAGLALAAAGPLPGAAQQPPPPPATTPSPAETNPLPTTTAPNPPQDPARPSAPVPDKALAPPTVPPADARPGAAQSRPPLVSLPGDGNGEGNDVDEVSLPAKPAAILSGRAKWEEAVPSLRRSFGRMEAELARRGLTPAGLPLAVFTRTDDDGFQYEAMIPLLQAPPDAKPDAKSDAKPGEEDALRFGTTPSGKALRFQHRGSYEAIDGTYETLTAYLDAKDIMVQDRFIEEYVTDLKEGDDALDVNIYALTR